MKNRDWGTKILKTDTCWVVFLKSEGGCDTLTNYKFSGLSRKFCPAKDMSDKV